ncbi:MAG TPA: S9 family peptidase [Cytophagaceae bacterium]|jgi:oligopeptidase B
MRAYYYPLFSLFFLYHVAKFEEKEMITPPLAAKKPFEITAKHGHNRIDDYYWLREREDANVIAYLEEENDYADKVLQPLESIRETLFKEMKGRIKEKDESAPFKKGAYWYYSRFEEGFEYPVFARKKSSLSAQEEIIANGNELGKGKSYFDIHVSVSPDHKTVAILTDTVGRRFYDISFKDIASGKLYPDRIEGTEGNLEWYNDNKTTLYSIKDPETLIASKVYRHTLGSHSVDPLVYEEKDSTLTCYISKASTDAYLFISAARTDASQQLFLDANNSNDKAKLIAPLKDNVKYSADQRGEYFYILTNENAPNYKLAWTTVTEPEKENWQVLIPENPEVLIENIQTFKDFLVLQEVAEGLNKIRLVYWDTVKGKVIPFDEPAYYATIGTNAEFDSNIIRFEYQSMTTPNSTYEFNTETGEKVLIKQQEVLGGFEKDKYQTERVMVKVRDGVSVPVSIVYRKDKFKKDGTNPCLQYAYGSYGYSMSPYFSASRISLLDRGFVYAIAHIRGGQEMGGQWYNDGKMMKKKNTFYDFIDCGKYLLDNRYAAPDKLFAQGGSAGGLLMGAVANMAPKQYKGIHAAVPFVDVVTTMMDETIPLTTFEWKEWGNPNIQEEYEYMLSYSPYDNVAKKAYPHMLVTTGLHDSQVQYWEPAKWVAKLRANKTDNNILVLKTNMTAGHGGQSGRFERLKEVALEYGFFVWLANKKDVE